MHYQQPSLPWLQEPCPFPVERLVPAAAPCLVARQRQEEEEEVLRAQSKAGRSVLTARKK